MLQAQDLKAPSKTEDLLQYGAIAARMLKEIAEATGVPCLKTIAGLTMLIIQTVQTVRYNKDECIRMTECTYWLICAIINICKNTEAELPPTMVRNIERLQDTLQKLLSYVRMHVDGTLLQRVIKHMHISSLLSDCNKAIQHALDVFGVQSHVITAVTLAEMQDYASRRHQEVMNVLSSKLAVLPPGTTLEDLRRSSSSLSLLPTLPLTFDGRDKEVITIMQNNTPARIDILGPGGIGKTSLTLSVQHDHNIVAIYGTRQWKQENTSLLSDGVDKLSSIEKSISISVSSPRMRNSPAALELLSLLALLPDGISEAALLQMKLPFDNVPKCRLILVSTSLAYVDGRGRVKVLTPIREYTRTYHPPRREFLQSLNAYLNQILDVWMPNDDYPSQRQIDVISNELENIYSILDYNLRIAQDYADNNFQTVKTVISLLQLMNWTALGSIDFLLSFSSIIKQLRNQKLQGQILYHLGNLSRRYVTSRDAEKDLQDAYDCFESVGALNEQVMVTISLSYLTEDPIKASYIARKAVSIATHGSLDIHVQCRAFEALSSALLNSGYVNDALHLLQEPETLSRATGNLKGELICINIRARAYVRLGKFEEASMLCNRAAQIYDVLDLKSSALGQTQFLDLTFTHGAMFYLKSEYRHCREVTQKLLQIFRPEYLRDTLIHAMVLHNLIDANIARGFMADPQTQRNIEQLESMRELLSSYRLGYTNLLSWNWSQIYFENGDLKNAALQCLESLGLTSQWQSDEYRPLRLNFLGDIYLQQQKQDHAMNSYLLSLIIAHKLQFKSHIHQAIRRVGDVFLALDDINTAISLFETALEGFTEMDIHRGKGECMIRLGDIAYVRGELGKARILWTNAIHLFKKSEQGKEVLKCNNRLQVLESR